MIAADIFLKGHECNPDGVLFTNHDGTRMRYCDAHERIEAIAAALQAGMDDAPAHWAVYSPNDAAAFLCILSIFRAGGCWLPVNTRNSVEDNAYILKRNDCTLLFFHSSLEESVRQLAAKVPEIRSFVCIDAPSDLGPSLSEFMASVAEGAQAEEPSRDPDAVTAMLATGGTTGLPKATAWTNRVWECLMASFLIHMPVGRRRPVYLVAAPMTHAAGVIALPLIAKGAEVVILEGVDPPVIMEAIEKHGVTHLFLPPTAIYMLLDHPRLRMFDYSSLEHFIYSASPMSATRLIEAMEVFGPVMTQGYGQAEVPFLCTFMSPQDHVEALQANALKRFESCGRPTQLMRLRIVDENDREVPPGELGEIVVQGSLVHKGYYKDPEMTRETLRDGWHHTGDIGRIDDDGFVYIVDRKKDMIITGGFNVFSSEVEQVLMAFPDIANCAVIGIPDDKWGEAVTAFVQLKPGAVADAGEIIAFCKERLGGVKAPKSVVFRDRLPLSPVGKVLKRRLREPFWQGRKRRV